MKMKHKYMHKKAESIAAKVGAGMMALDRLNDAEFCDALKEYNSVAPSEHKLTAENYEVVGKAELFWFWYYEAKVALLQKNTLQN